MPCYNFTTHEVNNLVKEILTFLTDSSKFAGGRCWQLLEPATVADFDENERCILKGVGDGEDEIYVGMRIIRNDNNENVQLQLNGFAGYDDGLEWAEQPGNIYHDTYPIVPLPDLTRMQCWLSANSYRFIFVIQLSTQFESAYLGWMQPISVERQYPYPLVIGGSHITGGVWTDTGGTHSLWTNPGGTETNERTTLRVRLSDGQWRAALNGTSGQVTNKIGVWPQNTHPTNVLTVLNDSLTVENVIMFPMLLYQGGNLTPANITPIEPRGIIGQFDGVYFIGNREDISAKDFLMYHGRPYIVFYNVNRRGNDEYFCMEWF